jgi:hypothetical protein
LVVLSKPSVRRPRTRDDGSCWDAARWYSAYDWVKAAALASSVYPRCQMTRPVTIVGKDPLSVRQQRCFAAARQSVGRCRPPRASTITRQDGQHGFARRTLETSPQADADIMGVARQAPATTTSHLGCQLNAKRQDASEDTCDKRLAVTKELNVGRFVPKIDGDGAVCACRFGCFPPVSPPSHQVSSADETPGDEHMEISRPS